MVRNSVTYGAVNAEVTMALVTLDGQRNEVSWDRAAFPYLIEVCWQDGGPPLMVVESRDQRGMQILAVSTGRACTTKVSGRFSSMIST